jgi:hypothetical protein
MVGAWPEHVLNLTNSGIQNRKNDRKWPPKIIQNAHEKLGVFKVAFHFS